MPEEESAGIPVTPVPQGKFNSFLEKTFNHSGGVYVGLATAMTFVCLVADSLTTKWNTPEWWTDAPLGVYCVILITFAGSKILSYFVNSKFNSPLGTPPEEKK